MLCSAYPEMANQAWPGPIATLGMPAEQTPTQRTAEQEAQALRRLILILAILLVAALAYALQLAR
jgi:hypothetical protein